MSRFIDAVLKIHMMKSVLALCTRNVLARRIYLGRNVHLRPCQDSSTRSSRFIWRNRSSHCAPEMYVDWTERCLAPSFSLLVFLQIKWWDQKVGNLSAEVCATVKICKPHFVLTRPFSWLGLYDTSFMWCKFGNLQQFFRNDEMDPQSAHHDTMRSSDVSNALTRIVCIGI